MFNDHLYVGQYLARNTAPAPGTLALLALGLPLIGLAVRRRSTSK